MKKILKSFGRLKPFYDLVYNVMMTFCKILLTGDILITLWSIYGRKKVEPTYEKIDDGKWIGDDNYGVVHRIASDGSEKGTGSFCIKWALEQSNHIRIDTHAYNSVMQGMLRKLGFTYCGTIYVHEDNAPRMAFEKVIL